MSSLDAYARWATSYHPWAHNPLMQAEEALMRQHFPDFANKTVLDLACGSGRYGLIATEAGASRVLGCDNSPEMLAVNAMQHKCIGRMDALPLASHSVDVILCGLAIGHLPDLPGTCGEISRLLKPDGVALLSDFHPQQYSKGGLRTFRDADGFTFSVEHYLHTEDSVRQAAKQAGLRLMQVDAAAVPDAPSPGPAVIVYQLLLRGLTSST